MLMSNILNSSSCTISLFLPVGYFKLSHLQCYTYVSTLCNASLFVFLITHTFFLCFTPLHKNWQNTMSPCLHYHCFCKVPSNPCPLFYFFCSLFLSSFNFNSLVKTGAIGHHLAAHLARQPPDGPNRGQAEFFFLESFLA